MAVQRSVNWISQARVDVPDMRAVESSVRNDFDQLIQAFATGTTQGYVMRGFNILMAGAIGGASNSLVLQVDPGALLHIAASQSGTILMVPAGTPNQQLNSATNTNVVGAFSPSAINYVTIDYIRFIDPTTSAQVYIWNPTSNTETSLNTPRAQILEYQIHISTVTPPPNLLPIAVVLTDSGNNVISITDARWLFCRLGTGGANPNPAYSYPWLQGRSENPSTSTSNGSNPFTGGDKDIGSLKELLNALMSIIKEMKGTPFWYSPFTFSGSLIHLREDAANTVITGSGNISHGILPNSVPILTTTGNTVFNSDQLTSLASTAGLVVGDFIFGYGIPPLTTILNIVGSTVTMSQVAIFTGTGSSISFYSPSVVTAPGQINWDKPIHIRVIGSALSYTVATNYSSTNVTLSDNQVAYITLVRDVAIIPNLIFTNGSPTVTSVGAVPWTGLLTSGDLIRLASDGDNQYYKILTVDSLTQVTLVNNFTGISTGALGIQSVYAFGSYTSAAIPSTSRDIFIASRELVPSSADVFWLFIREDDGGPAKIYVRLLGSELANGEDAQVGGGTSNELLQYIGSPSESASKPQYVSAINPGSVPQITSITTGSAASMTSSQYFLIRSSADARVYEVWVSINGAGTQTTISLANEYLRWNVLSTDTAAQTAAKLSTLLNSTANRDFTSVVVSGSTLSVTNNSAGTATNASNFNISAPFSISITQTGTGFGNFNIQDGDSLTLAIKELDIAIGTLNFFVSSNYQETVTIVASGATPPITLNGPISSGTIINLPLNTRAGNVTEFYLVNSAKLEVFLNGQKLIVTNDYDEVGIAGSFSYQIQILRNLPVEDVLEFRIGTGGGSGTAGPPGPVGPPGPTGSDAVGGPINISTKVSNYTVLSSDNVLLANCTGGAITFTLPTAASSTGRVYYFKKIDSTVNAMTIQAFGAELIDGFNTQLTTTQYQTFMLITDGTAWYLF